ACAGGGYEITLTCDHRIATDDPATRIGLPETTLGLIPAWGGCARLPRLIGVEEAAEVILKGKLCSAQEALKLGLVDEVASRDQLLDRARQKLRDGKRPSPGASRPPLPGRGEARGVAGGEGRTISNAGSSRALEIINRTLSITPAESLKRELNAIVDLGKKESTQNLIR